MRIAKAVSFIQKTDKYCLLVKVIKMHKKPSINWG